jgi:pimeloyl-ACP methyl ester carboxylesterase
VTRPLAPVLAMILGAAAAVATTAPGSAAEDPAGNPPPEPNFPALAADAPAGSGVMQPCLTELEGQIRCGRYRVYEDRAARSGRTLDLAFVVADALDPKPDVSTAVTFFFGGPGSGVTEEAGSIIPWRSDLRQQRDLLLVDFRGAGNSGALDCDVPYPGGVASRFGAIFPLDHVIACRDRLSERARLDLYTTDHSMDDIDELRAWLNYGTLDLIGASYGTREIQVFLRRHPEAARSVILDGVAPLAETSYVKHAWRLQQALDELVAECTRDEACSANYPDLAAMVAALFERVRRDPPSVAVEEAWLRLGPGEIGYALRGLLYGRAGEIPSFVARAARGDWQPFADYYLQRTDWVSGTGGNAGMHFSVICAEDISRVSDEEMARETAGTFLGDHLIAGYRRVCDIWPHAKLDPWYWSPVKSDVPALLLSGSHDPVTPPSGADAVARHLPNSLHLIVPGAGHGVGGPCIEAIQRRFVETASVEGLDTSCIEVAPRTEFAVPGAD